MTNLELITAALRELGIIDETETPSAEQGQQGLTRLNQLMSILEQSDLSFPSWFAQSLTTDALPVPDWVELYVTYSLAIALAPSYGVSVSQELAALAESTRAIVLRKRLNQKLQPVRLSMPSAEGDTCFRDITSG